MPPLPTELRRQLEKTVMLGREVAEEGARAALEVLGVRSENPLSPPGQNDHRLALRARGRVLGGGGPAGLDNGWKPLCEEVAYEQWHRMLFARFLAENELLIHPIERVWVTLQECAELAESEGEPDEWMVAAKYASAMLPGIFRRDDPSSRVRFATNHRQELEALLNALPAVLFQADDALGWVYQFWQTKAKQEVNASGRKVGGKDLAPVTQLFTEHYMVRFLLENSLGAWWAARHPASPLLKEWEYLRFRDDGTPAAGTFDAWPATAAEVTVMDPCCGSGHFLVAAADMLRKMRMEEEGLSEGEASAAVLRDNLFGLELDPRCTQIAAFALSFDAWKHGVPPPRPRTGEGAGGEGPLPNVACTGISVGGQMSEWTKLAGDDRNLRDQLERLYQLFKDAPDLGSLINPNDVPVRDRMFLPDYAKVAPLLESVLAKSGDDPVAAVYGSDARGAAGAGALLARTYTLVTTNPPYLSRGKQDETLKAFADLHHKEAKADLATMFIERCRAFAADGGGYAMVTPQNWLFLGSYKKLRERLLHAQTWGHVARLGPGAFDTISGEVVNVTLVVLGQRQAESGHEMTGIDASAPKASAEKARLLRQAPLAVVEQAAQLRNPDARIAFEEQPGMLLQSFADSYQGITTGDNSRWRRSIWELAVPISPWNRLQSNVEDTAIAGGKTDLLRWEDGGRRLASNPQARIQGLAALGQAGVAVAQMRELPVTSFHGDLFDMNTAVIVPHDSSHLPAIWAFCSSPEFNKAVRRIDQALKVTNASLVKVPFDLAHWQKEADHLYPEGLPEPQSDDPTQWLFKGNVVGSEAPLQVAMARLLGYRWPDQPADVNPGIESLDHLVDEDGIVCLPSVNGEHEAAERLRAVLVAAHANPPSGQRPRGAPAWPALPASPNTWIEQLLAQAGSPGKSLEEWLRDGFFEQHVKLFHQRPFVWHIWDGLKDGFSALVNYHKLDHACLQKLIYVYLNWWIEVQKRGADAGEVGAETRLAAAEKLKRNLELILEGEEPHDIYVRWKAEQEQAIGWHPDLDDGVRMNIRPFMTCHQEHPMNVLRKQPNIGWGPKPDRGKNPDGSERKNDIHLSIRHKREARRNTSGGPA